MVTEMLCSAPYWMGYELVVTATSVKMCSTNRGHRLGPFSVSVEEDVESQYLRYLTDQPQGVLFSEAVDKHIVD